MQRVEMAWALFQDLPVPGLGLGKIAEPVVRDRPGKQVCDLVTLPIGRRHAENIRLWTHPLIAFRRVVSSKPRSVIADRELLAW
jgi:hypothetical protein